MPADFDKCISDGGDVKTIKPKENKYMRICYDKNGKYHSGEVMTNKAHKQAIVRKKK